MSKPTTLSSKVKERYQNLRTDLKKWPRHTLVELLIGGTLIFALLLVGIFGDFLVPYDPQLRHPTQKNVSPNFDFLMGTDQLGRDIFSRVIFGTRESITVAFISVIISFVLGAPLGVVSGYFGGPLDKILTILADSFWGFPTIIMAILIAWILGPSAINTAIAVGVAVTPRFFRIVRSEALSIKEWTFIEAERSLGASAKRIIFYHVFPNTFPSLLVLMTLGIGQSIIAISGLGFLGLGLPPPTPEWGTDIGRARFFLPIGVWWSTIFPAVMIFITVFAFNLFGEGLGTILKPKYKGR